MHVTHPLIASAYEEYWPSLYRYLLSRVGVKEDADDHSTESHVYCRELQTTERQAIRLLPPQRKKIYELTRFAGQTPAELAQSLSLSVRTVENHLRMGRSQVREYIRKCV